MSKLLARLELEKLALLEKARVVDESCRLHKIVMTEGCLSGSIGRWNETYIGGCVMVHTGRPEVYAFKLANNVVSDYVNDCRRAINSYVVKQRS